jgi:hypothetical protein
MEERLANEIIDASNNTGSSVKKREDTHVWLKQTKRLLITAGKHYSGKYYFDEWKEKESPWHVSSP